MRKTNKILILIIFFSIILLLRNVVYASSTITEKVKEEATSIIINEGKFSKKIIGLNQENNEVTMQLNFQSRESKVIKENTEIIFLIDNSTSMNSRIGNSNDTRKIRVTNSTKELINNISNNNSNTKMGIVYFSSSATILQGLTNSKEQLLSACNNFENQSTLGSTNMIEGINLAKSNFSSDSSNKILVLLTDGIPSNSEQAVKDSLKDEGIYIITTLVGLENATDTEKATINNIFGSVENPVADKFYNISDSEIEKTIIQNIYNKIVEDFQSTTTNINIQDYFPQDILNNFDIIIKDPSKGNVSKDKDYILWNIPELKSSENATLEYVLKLKENYDKNIINKIMDTNQKVELKYNDINNNSQIKTMEDSPQIILKESESEIENEKKDIKSDKSGVNSKSGEILIGSDNTTANKILSHTGYKDTILVILIVVSINMAIIGIRMKFINKNR